MTNAAIASIFVYGSLRSGFKSPAYEYISRYFDLAGDATVDGVLYDMGEYPAGQPGTSGRIVGELYTIKHPDEFSWALAQLDDYEGVNTENGDKAPFRREIVTVHIKGNEQPAWIYWFNGNTAGRPVIASGDLMEYIQSKQP